MPTRKQDQAKEAPMPIEKPPPARPPGRTPTASGDELEAWLYLPEGPGPHPAVVMAHGIGAIKAGGLAPFAERFRREGLAAVVVASPQEGGPAGPPPQEPSFPPHPRAHPTRLLS